MQVKLLHLKIKFGFKKVWCFCLFVCVRPDRTHLELDAHAFHPSNAVDSRGEVPVFGTPLDWMLWKILIFIDFDLIDFCFEKLTNFQRSSVGLVAGSQAVSRREQEAPAQH